MCTRCEDAVSVVPANHFSHLGQHDVFNQSEHRRYLVRKPSEHHILQFSSVDRISLKPNSIAATRLVAAFTEICLTGYITNLLTTQLHIHMSVITRKWVGSRKPLFPHLAPIRANMSGCSLWSIDPICWGVYKERSEHPRLSNRDIIFWRIPTYVIAIPERDGRTDDLPWQYRVLRSIAL